MEGKYKADVRIQLRNKTRIRRYFNKSTVDRFPDEFRVLLRRYKVHLSSKKKDIKGHFELLELTS